MGKILKFVQLPDPGKRLLFIAFIVVCTIRLGLSVLGFDNFCRLVSRARPYLMIHDNREALEESDILWATRVASRYIPKATCLTQALAVYLLLGRTGAFVKIRIGVCKDERGNLEAHAWLERKGNVFFGDNGRLQRYSVLPPLKVL